MPSTSFDRFASFYDRVMGAQGDYTHRVTIDPALFAAMEEINGKVIYDIGCVNGSVARKMAKKGAREVWASDISPELIALATHKYPSFKIKYFARDGMDFRNIPSSYFDIVVLNMSIHYFKDIDKLFLSINRVLKKKGKIVFTADHPLKPLTHFDEGRIKSKIELVSKASCYLKCQKKLAFNPWTQKNDLLIYVRSLESYVKSLSSQGFYVNKIIEPTTRQLSSYFGGKIVSSRIPAYIAICATKISP